MGDLTQEIRERLEPLMIPPHASPTTVGMSPHRVQANHLAAGLTNTLGSLRSRLCKKFCNSVNCYKTVTVAIFLLGEKNRVRLLDWVKGLKGPKG